MAATGALTHLYQNVLPKIGDRVWISGRIEKANKMTQHVRYLNEMRFLDQVQLSLKQGDITAEYFEDIPRMKAQEAESRMADIERELTKYEYGATYEALDIFGKSHPQTLPQVEEGEFPALVLRLYFELGESMLVSASEISESELLYHVIARKLSRTLSERWRYHSTTAYEFWKIRWLHEDRHQDGEVWVTIKGDPVSGGLPFGFKKLEDLRVEQSAEEERVLEQWRKTREKLTSAIIKHAERLKDVDNIVCFGLGNLERRKPRTFVQHLAAVTIRNTLQEIRAARGIPGTIPILAQDPLYCPHCRYVLHKDLGIETVTDLTGFQSITQTSFVVSICAGGPIGQIIADLTLSFGGPTAFLCEDFKDDYLAQEHSPDAISGYGSNEPTKNMVDYQKRCIKEDVSDMQDILGMTRE
jgi:hypothetical protein